MELIKVLGTFDCDIVDNGGICREIQLLELMNGKNIIKFRYESVVSGQVFYFKVSISVFEGRFKINLSEEQAFVKLLNKN